MGEGEAVESCRIDRWVDGSAFPLEYIYILENTLLGYNPFEYIPIIE